jgi:signal transduction histidine kinase
VDGHSVAARLAVPRWRWLAPALAVGVGYYVAARLGLTFTLKPYPISTLWPPNALLMAALLLTRPRDWWWLLAAALPAHLLAELQSGVPTGMVLGWYASNCSEALIGAAMVRNLGEERPRFCSLRDASTVLLSGAIAAPLLSSFVDAAFVKLLGWGASSYWDLVSRRFFSNVLAELTVLPLVLTWAGVVAAGRRKMPATRVVEAATLAGGLVLVCLYVFDVGHTQAGPALYYLPLPFLLWAAVRFGPVGIATALPVMTVATIWGAVDGLGPFAGQPPLDIARQMQWFLISVSVPLLLLAVALDERERIEHESHAQLTHLSRVATLGELSGGIAHELNQPLTAILSNAQAAQHFLHNQKADPLMLDEILQDIIVADRRASQVIDRLRAMFKRGETHFEALDLNTLVHEVLAIAQGDFTTRGVEARVELAARLPMVKGDRVQLEQVLLNLLVNGAEAMAGCAPNQRVLRIRSLATAKKVHLSVVDRGTGFSVPPSKLFEAFYTTKPQGLGLGLSISKSIISNHGGQLLASTLRRGGASFLVTLPALQARS